MARTRSNPSQPNDASQEPQRGENPTERRQARDTREVGVKFKLLELKRF
jgi:hypothetical protein